MQELIVDFITSLDGYGAAKGWHGWWGLESPEYLAWLEQEPERDYSILMGANTYRLMSGLAEQTASKANDETRTDEDASCDQLTKTPKIVFLSSLQNPLTWANTQLITGDVVDAVKVLKLAGQGGLRTLGSLSLCRSLLQAGLVDRFRVIIFPVITGKTGFDRIYDAYPDVSLKMKVIQQWHSENQP